MHSHNLTLSHAVTQHVMDAIDVIVGSPQALPKPLEAMLFQLNASGVLAYAGLISAYMQSNDPPFGAVFTLSAERLRPL